MFWKKSTPLSLRAQLLLLLLPGMVVIICAELWLTRVDAIEAANGAFDRSLNGAIRSIDANVSTTSGGLAVEMPYRMFEFFQLTADGNIYFRVATSDGLVEIGNPDLPQPAEPLTPGVPVFHDAVYFGEEVRIGTYVRLLESPLRTATAGRLVIQVAEGASSRRAFTRSFLLRTAARDALVISLVGVTLAFLVTLTLRPVAKLANEVTQRQASDLRPLGHERLPREIQPLVDAVNEQLDRTRDLVERQRMFIDDASHQLRTPLATLHTQIGYALRERDPAVSRPTLISISEQLESATRSTNQLLALARNDATALAITSFDLNDLLREVATRFLPLARGKALDFGVDAADEPCSVRGDRQLLGEALANLVHNAVSYSNEEGRVTLACRCERNAFELSVVNTGPALPPGVLERLGQRFVKGEDSRGAGLGLAIAVSIAERHGGGLSVRRSQRDESNTVTLRWLEPIA